MQPVSERHVFRQKFLSAFIEDYVSDEHFTAEKRERIWLLQIAEMTDVTLGLEAIILAVCTARIGYRDNNANLTHRSLILYNTSIRELQRAIDHPTLRRQEQTLATCIAFTLYEFSSGTTPREQEFLSHYHGTMELLRLGGPLRSGSGLRYSVLRTLRVQSVGSLVSESLVWSSTANKVVRYILASSKGDAAS